MLGHPYCNRPLIFVECGLPQFLADHARIRDGAAPAAWVLHSSARAAAAKLPFVAIAADGKLSALYAAMRPENGIYLPRSKEGNAMRPTVYLSAFCVFISPAFAYAAGTALTDNFSVIGPNEAIAELVAKQAELFRKQAALDWFGKELSPGTGPTIIHIALSADEDKGLSWCKDSSRQKFHRIWLTTSAEKAVGSTLNHEVVHTVVASFMYPKFMPAWANEGIASQVDDDGRKQSRERIAVRWASGGNWPQLSSLFAATRIDHSDAEGYAAAASVAQFLVSLGGKAKVVEFAKSGMQDNWDKAAHETYGVRDVADLQSRWQSWVRGRTGEDARQATARAPSGSAGVN